MGSLSTSAYSNQEQNYADQNLGAIILSFILF